ncbi:cell wall-active antibiotics response protein LiaF [Latilactobacillus fuchuensis]|uniref:Uncharacterized protein n=1 Tax=Latilactobacillus fuchuensis DSM 14340 = JCM 11249 TaxID=1423747 RepID=A0A0R1RWN4_9LACO|nr:cell wall-active antibiotics response protein LiaF [Latilactobacillus fuchuensis]KRL60889.1 hypothetical protein FC69_GL001129 [Latilactobacillus fuchuensis DSM 14340 = JCM 11249]
MPIVWRIFLIIEAIIFGTFIWQIISYPANLFFIIFGIVCLIWANKRRGNRKVGFLTTLLTMIGTISILVTLFINFSLWLLLINAVVFLALNHRRVGQFNNRNLNQLFDNAPWHRKNFVPVNTKEPTAKSDQVKRHQWSGNQTIGNNIFEWDDINFAVVAGDTIIDLGSTILPKADNHIVIRKGFGKTRILVPVGTGVYLDHSAMMGSVIIENQRYNLKNESIQLYSKNYDEESRHLKIITNVVIGDLEVILV